MMHKTLELPTWMIHQSFRYCLGRRTYAVSDFVDWALTNFNRLPESTKSIMLRELKEAFAHNRGLGDQCDREQWQKLLKGLEVQSTDPANVMPDYGKGPRTGGFRSK